MDKTPDFSLFEHCKFFGYQRPNLPADVYKLLTDIVIDEYQQWQLKLLGVEDELQR